MTPFEEVLGWHLSCGVVHSTPTVFCLVHHATWDPISRTLTEGIPNAWFVTLAAASSDQKTNFIRELMSMLPSRMPWIVWLRASRKRPHNLHAYTWDQLAKKASISPSK